MVHSHSSGYRQELSDPSHEDLSMHYFYLSRDKVADFSQSKQSKEEQGRGYNAFCDLALEVILCHLRNTQLVRDQPYLVKKGMTQGYKY